MKHQEQQESQISYAPVLSLSSRPKLFLFSPSSRPAEAEAPAIKPCHRQLQPGGGSEQGPPPCHAEPRQPLPRTEGSWHGRSDRTPRPGGQLTRCESVARLRGSCLGPRAGGMAQGTGTAGWKPTGRSRHGRAAAFSRMGASARSAQPARSLRRGHGEGNAPQTRRRRLQRGRRDIVPRTPYRPGKPQQAKPPHGRSVQAQNQFVIATGRFGRSRRLEKQLTTARQQRIGHSRSRPRRLSGTPRPPSSSAHRSPGVTGNWRLGTNAEQPGD